MDKPSDAAMEAALDIIEEMRDKTGLRGLPYPMESGDLARIIDKHMLPSRAAGDITTSGGAVRRKDRR